MKAHQIAATAQPTGYPLRNQGEKIPPSKISWEVDYPEYAPVEYLAPSVLAAEGTWAESNTPPRSEEHYRSQLGPIQFENGRPLNPMGRTGITNRGLFGSWGPNFAADCVLLRVLEESSPEALLILRKDNGKYAFPGGFRDRGESPLDASIRELEEETQVVLPEMKTDAALIYSGYVDDPRTTDHAWIETTAYGLALPAEKAKKIHPKGSDDAASASWMKIEDSILLNMHGNHAEILKLALQFFKLKS